MDVLTTCLAIIVGIALGALIVDWRARRAALEALKDERRKVTEALAAITATVNPLTQGMQDLRDRIGAQEMRAAQGNRATHVGARG